MSVPDVGMAMHALLDALIWCCGQHCMHKVFVTGNAGALGDAFVARLDLNGIFEIAQSKRQRMEESVVCFGYPFAREIVR